MATGYLQHSRVSVLSNLWLLFFIWILTHCGSSSLELLQSSLNPYNGLGVTTMSIIYASKTFSCLFGPFIVLKLTPKWTLLLGLIMQLLYVGANFYPKWYVLYPFAALVGFSYGPMWICFGVYTTTLAVYYANMMPETKASILSMFNGILSITLPLAMAIGSIISTTVLKYVKFDDGDFSDDNTTDIANIMPSFYNISANITVYDENSYCAVNYCPTVVLNTTFSDETADNESTDKYTLFILLSIYAVLDIISILLTVCCLKNLPQTDIRSGMKHRQSVCQHILSYIKAFFNWRYLLLIPCFSSLYLFISLEQSTFMKGYVTCSYGIEMVGISGLVFGVTTAFTSCVSGLIGQCVHRNYLFLLAYIVMLLHLGLLLVWELLPWRFVFVGLASSSAGFSVGIFVCHWPAFIGDVFTSEKTEAFAFYNFITSLSLSIGYIATRYLCAVYQVYTLFVMLAVSFVTYTIFSIYTYKSGQLSPREMQLQESGPMISAHRSKSIAELTNDRPISMHGDL